MTTFDDGIAFSYKKKIDAPFQTVNEALTEALKLIPSQYKDDFRKFYTFRGDSPRQEFIDYFYSLDDQKQNIEKALSILKNAHDPLVLAYAIIESNTDKMKVPLERIKNK
ncbi:MAG: hypothetical protein Q8R37_00395 [Nanoarchaeota archaeon]|nr:hypothetical protein [Nanoarchaeota archaeon]